MKSIDQIAAELQGYDPQALSAADVARFLSLLVAPVTERLELPLAVVNELVEGVSLLAREVGQGDEALLVCQRWHAQRE